VKHINKAFSPIINTIAAYSGSIERFAGDAIINIFRALDDSDEAVSHQIMLAVQCGMEIISKYSEYTSQSDDIHLRIHIAVAAGDLAIVNVGGSDKSGVWRRVVTGQPFQQISSAIDESEAGQLVVSDYALSFIKSRVKSSTVSECNSLIESVESPVPITIRYPTTLNTDMERIVRTYIEPTIQSRIDAGQTNWFAEVRNVAILFLNLKGIDLFTLKREMNNEQNDLVRTMTRRTLNRHIDNGLDDNISLLHQVIQRIQQIIYSYDGSVANCLVDDKGTSIVACFGFPLSHPDEPMRAVKAAQQIEAEVGSFKLKCSMGITSGNTLCGSVGNTTRQEATVMGDAVNLASRLMMQSEDSIYCDESIKLSTESEVQYSGEKEVKLKGKEGVFKIYIPGLIKRRDEEEDGLLTNYIKNGSTMDVVSWNIRDLSIRNASSFLLIEGDVGFGKTELLQEVKRQASNYENIAILTGTAFDTERLVPYFVWGPVFRSLILRYYHVLAFYKLWKAETKLKGQLNSDIAQQSITNDQDVTESAKIVQTVLQLLKLDEKPYAYLLSPIFRVEFVSSGTDELGSDEKSSLTNRILLKIFSRIQRHMMKIFDRKPRSNSSDDSEKMGDQTPTDSIDELIRKSFEFDKQISNPTKGFVLALDNLQWFDPDSVQLLNGVLLDKHLMDSIVILVTTRPVLNATSSIEVIQGMAEQKLVLSSFSQENTIKLMCQILGQHLPIDEILLAIVMKKSQGNPFLIVQIVLSLQNTKSVVVQFGRYQLAEQYKKNTDLLKLPDTVSATLHSTIDRLYPTEQLVLKVASVIGMTFNSDVLKAVFPISSQVVAIDDNLKQLVKFGLIIHVGEEVTTITTNTNPHKRHRHSFSSTGSSKAYRQSLEFKRSSVDLSSTGSSFLSDEEDVNKEKRVSNIYKFRSKELHEMCYRLLLQQSCQDLHWRIAGHLIRQAKTTSEDLNESIATHLTKYVLSRSERTEQEVNTALYFLVQSFDTSTHLYNVHSKSTKLKTVFTALQLVQFLPVNQIRDKKEVQLRLIYCQMLQELHGKGTKEEWEMLQKCFQICPSSDKVYFRCLWYYWYNHYCACSVDKVPELDSINLKVLQLAEQFPNTADTELYAHLLLLKEHERLGIISYEQIDNVERGLYLYSKLDGAGVDKFIYRYGQMDPGLHFLCHGIRLSWLLGKNTLFMMYISKGLDMIRRSRHWPSVTFFFSTCCHLLYLRQDYSLLKEIALEMEIATKKNHYYMRDLAWFYQYLAQVQEGINSAESTLSIVTVMNQAFAKLEKFFMDIDLPMSKITAEIPEVTLTPIYPIVMKKSNSFYRRMSLPNIPYVSEQDIDEKTEYEDIDLDTETQYYSRPISSVSFNLDTDEIIGTIRSKLPYICCTEAYRSMKQDKPQMNYNKLIESINCPQQNTCGLILIALDCMIDVGEALDQILDVLDRVRNSCQCNQHMFNLNVDYLQAKLELKYLSQNPSETRLLFSIESHIDKVIERASESRNQSLMAKTLLLKSVLLAKQKKYYETITAIHSFIQEIEGESIDVVDLRYLYNEANKQISSMAISIIPSMKSVDT
jgi:class 3 adenylate cyclase